MLRRAPSGDGPTRRRIGPSHLWVLGLPRRVWRAEAHVTKSGGLLGCSPWPEKLSGPAGGAPGQRTSYAGVMGGALSKAVRCHVRPTAAAQRGGHTA
ncbi:hypothetical protein NDU88_002004 [Pleurodeles waltl]|uniref:Uncharacterized protein n=1 Tax=Pleurodeles waltl TaxID=8319 RepID=A0AAV7KQW8_PLEWA|nr:hypothetical protein NDU88_002004 [Pleurodeles waltl]